MDIKAILKANGIEGEVAEAIASNINQEIPKEFVSKTQYSKKVNAIDELNNKLADLEARSGNDEFKEKYETLEKEYNDFKTNIETEKVNASKFSTLRSKLKAEGVNEKLVNLLEKQFDINSIEIENDDIKGWNDIIKPIREEFKPLFPEQSIEGNESFKPPANTITGAEDPFLKGFGL